MTEKRCFRDLCVAAVDSANLGVPRYSQGCVVGQFFRLVGHEVPMELDYRPVQCFDLPYEWVIVDTLRQLQEAADNESRSRCEEILGTIDPSLMVDVVVESRKVVRELVA